MKGHLPRWSEVFRGAAALAGSKGKATKEQRMEVKQDTVHVEEEDDGLSDEGWEIFVEADQGHVKLAKAKHGRLSQPIPNLNKTEVTYTKGVEEILANLKEPLKVTYTVDPRGALEHLPACKDAISKEVNGISVAIRRLLPGTTEQGRGGGYA